MSRLTRDGTAELVSCETKFSGANAYREIFIFPVQLTMSRISNLTWLIHTLALCLTIRYLFREKMKMEEYCLGVGAWLKVNTRALGRGAL